MPEDKPGQSVFEISYNHYLNQLFSMLPQLSAERLGVLLRGKEIHINLLNNSYHILQSGIADPHGKMPSYDICVILLKYLLTDRNNYPGGKNWCSFRDLKDSNPLISYFKSNVENAIISEFSGDADRLKKSCIFLGGISPQEKYNQDISMLFNILPRVPILLLFNDEDEEFPAACSVLFERRAENYLDAECLAMAGRFLFESLKNA